MRIYRGTKNYRKIYETHHGPIPNDEQGRPYHIHHIDGNRNNNSIENLQLVSIQEHYQIHLAQNDTAAALMLAGMLNKNIKTLSELSRKTQLARIEKGLHSWANRGAVNGGDDKTVYSFENILTGVVENLTQYDFRIKYSLEACLVGNLIHGRQKTGKNWKMHGKDVGRKHSKPKINTNIYSFEHICTGTVEHMTKHDFCKKHGLNRGCINGLVKNNGKNKTHAGWRMLGTKDDRPFYSFLNAKTGEIVVMQSLEFRKKYKLNKSHLSQMLSGNPKNKSVGGWRLL